MGFESIAAELILIGALIYFGVLMTTTMNDAWMNMHETFNDYKTRITNRIDESILIMNASFVKDEKRVSLIVQNTGNKQLKINMTDVYIDDNRIPRLSLNRTLNMNESSEIKNERLWDSTEQLEINVTIGLSSGTHYVEVYTEYGSYAIKQFNVE